MPKSNIRTKAGKNPQKTKADIKRMNAGYYKKLDEFMLLSLEELKTLSLSNTIKGVYASSLTKAIEQRTEIDKYTKKAS